MNYQSIALEVYYIAKQASLIAMKYYGGDVLVDIKEDNSPVTQADKEISEFIIEELQKLTPQIAVVSEEQSDELNKEALKNNLFWLIDPIDGTKSFIRKKGEFTVNIALIEGNRPVGGAIFVPQTNIGYFTVEPNKAFKQISGSIPQEIKVVSPHNTGLRVVASFDHHDKITQKYIEDLEKVREVASISSSIKFCLIAEGSYDIYPKFTRTMEWDTAAGQAILEAAGGKVTDEHGKPLIYRKNNFENKIFFAQGA